MIVKTEGLDAIAKYTCDLNALVATSKTVAKQAKTEQSIPTI